MTTQARGRVRVEDGLKRVRAMLGGAVVADSTRVKMVWEIPYYPTYYFPPDDVRSDLFADSGATKRSPSRGTAKLHDVTVGNRSAPQAVRIWNEAAIDELVGYVSFHWASMDHWFEEDEEVYVHARDPYTRVDVLQSSRTVRIEVDGVVIAESDKPRLLFETGLPVRYYLPKTDVDFTLLAESDTTTACPYKGTARYWSVDVAGNLHEDLVWGYDTPLKESQDVAGYVAFYDEKVDVFVDGVLQERPKTKFT